MHCMGAGAGDVRGSAHLTLWLARQMGELPAYPVQVACEALADPHLEGKALMSAMAAASGVFYNYTNALECFDYKVGPNEQTDEDGAFWGYQVCLSAAHLAVFCVAHCHVSAGCSSCICTALPAQT